jgi:hypothetical protein
MMILFFLLSISLSFPSTFELFSSTTTNFFSLLTPPHTPTKKRLREKRETFFPSTFELSNNELLLPPHTYLPHTPTKKKIKRKERDLFSLHFRTTNFKLFSFSLPPQKKKIKRRERERERER